VWLLVVEHRDDRVFEHAYNLLRLGLSKASQLNSVSQVAFFFGIPNLIASYRRTDVDAYVAHFLFELIVQLLRTFLPALENIVI